MKFATPHMQRVAARVRRRHGMEMTPAQVAASLNKTIANVRSRMVAIGDVEFAEMSDAEIYLLMHEAMLEGGPEGGQS